MFLTKTIIYKFYTFT